MHRWFAWAAGAVCLVWVYGLFVHHNFEIRTPGNRWASIGAGSGGLYVWARHYVGSTGSAPPQRTTVRHRYQLTAGSDPFRSPVFEYSRDQPLLHGGTASEIDVVLPLWLVVGVLLVPPSQRIIRRHLRARAAAGRRAAGLCVSCGYDLSGTPDRCPECGQPASATGGA